MRGDLSSTAQVCSQCGWPFDIEALKSNTCKKCRAAILVTSIALLERFDAPAIKRYIERYTQTLAENPQDRDALLGVGICYLKLGLFDLADRFLAKLIDHHPVDPDGYGYRAICLLRGKRPRTASLPVIREADRLIGTAVELAPGDGRYEILLAALRHDYYVINGMRVPFPDPDDLVARAESKYIDALEIAQLLRLMKVGDGPVMQQFAT